MGQFTEFIRRLVSLMDKFKNMNAEKFRKVAKSIVNDIKTQSK